MLLPLKTGTTAELCKFYCRYPYKRVLTLTNGSKLPCKIEVVGQEARSQGLATFTTSPASGVIAAKGTFDVEVTLQASRLGRIQLPLHIKVPALALPCYCLLQPRLRIYSGPVRLAHQVFAPALDSCTRVASH